MQTHQTQGGRSDQAGSRSRRFRDRFAEHRGATVVEYALGVALLCVASIGVLQFLEGAASDEFGDRADRSGAPDLTGGEATDGSTDSGSGSDSSTDGPPPVTQEVFFGGFSNVKSTGNNPWTAALRVTVQESPGGPGISGVQVEGEWTYTQGSTTVTVAATCNQTNGSGACQFQLSDIPAGVGSVTFTMKTLSGGVPPVVYNGGTQTQVVPK
jgi:Flp pilus assembly pilin Flp